jgi:hypothetical protein
MFKKSKTKRKEKKVIKHSKNCLKRVNKRKNLKKRDSGDPGPPSVSSTRFTRFKLCILIVPDSAIPVFLNPTLFVLTVLYII